MFGIYFWQSVVNFDSYFFPRMGFLNSKLYKNAVLGTRLVFSSACMMKARTYSELAFCKNHELFSIFEILFGTKIRFLDFSNSRIMRGIHILSTLVPSHTVL